MNNKIADIFDEIAIILELSDENPFKISAYRNSARIIRNLSEDLSLLLEKGEIEKIKGFGKATVEKIKEILSTGYSAYLNELKHSIPESLFEILNIKGLGPKKVRTIWKKLNIISVGELEYACTENRLINLEGFGEKTQRKILEGIDFLKRSKGKFLIDIALITFQTVFDQLKSFKEIIEISPVGKTRRGSEIYDSVQLLISVNNIENLLRQ
jgi:DNA polymerase (family 10)